jgi:hypothetical protein
MRDERKRTKPAELNTAPLPALKIGLSADTVMVHQGLALLALIPLAFHNTHGRDDGIYRLTTRAKNCVSGS